MHSEMALALDVISRYRCLSKSYIWATDHNRHHDGAGGRVALQLNAVKISSLLVLFDKVKQRQLVTLASLFLV